MGNKDEISVLAKSIIYAVCATLCVVFLTFIAKQCQKSLNTIIEVADKNLSYVGQIMVFQEDTFMITNYYQLRSEYSLINKEKEIIIHESFVLKYFEDKDKKPLQNQTKTINIE